MKAVVILKMNKPGQALLLCALRGITSNTVCALQTHLELLYAIGAQAIIYITQ